MRLGAGGWRCGGDRQCHPRTPQAFRWPAEGRSGSDRSWQDRWQDRLSGERHEPSSPRLVLSSEFSLAADRRIMSPFPRESLTCTDGRILAGTTPLFGFSGVLDVSRLLPVRRGTPAGRKLRVGSLGRPPVRRSLGYLSHPRRGHQAPSSPWPPERVLLPERDSPERRTSRAGR